MPRQLVRTIRSLSPMMQIGIGTDDYELIVVDNGSRERPAREQCEAFGAALRWLRVDDAPASPAMALNRGIAAARAPLVGAMIDGARLASPGLLKTASTAARVDPRPVIASLGFHLGERPQQESVRDGYGEEREDALLAKVGWTSDGYRLFDVSVPALSSDRGWFGVPAESNALFMPKDLWGEVGGFDERFAAPGGGLVNLDLFARACELPRTRLVMLLGEATFHQVHGGASTDAGSSGFAELHDEYVRLRGRPFARPEVTPLHVGTVSPRAEAALARSLAGGRRS